MSGNVPSDRRVARTRAAIVSAYSDLVLRGGRQDIKVAEIVAHANVGRSTFYEHFSGADAVFLEALAGPLSLVADAISGQGDAQRLATMLRHFWENRQRARDMLTNRHGDRVSRLLADMVEARLDGDFTVPKRLIATQIAEIALAPVRSWLMAEASCPPAALASAIADAANSVLAALRAQPG